MPGDRRLAARTPLRWTGRLVLVVTLPVAYHCIFKLGFQRTDGRVLAHFFLGSAF